MRIKENFQSNVDLEVSNDDLNDVGQLRLFGSRIIVGKDNEEFYLLHSETGEIVCKITKLSDFVHKDRVIWAKIDTDNQHQMMINKRGGYLIDIRTSANISSRPPNSINQNTFVTDKRKIKWNEYDFELLSESDKESSSDSTNNSDSDHIEEFLKDVELKFGKPSDRIDDVKAEVPLVEIFNELGEGNMDDGDFVPPTQSEYADFGYIILKNNASSRNSHMFSEEYREDWKGRLRRTWPSLVRDSHFSTKINQESESFDAVSDGIEQDLKGADSVIVDDGTEYHVNLFVDSKKSNKYFKHKKSNRQEKSIMMDDMADDGPVNIVVTTDIDGEGASEKINSRNNRDIYLYSDEHIEAVKKVIKENREKIEDKNGNTLCRVI